MAQAFIPWKSQVQQAFATGQLNERQMEKQMAAGTFGEVQETYEETGRQADRAARNRSMDIQENAQNAQIGLGKYQTAVSAVGALGMLGLGYSAVQSTGLFGATAVTGTTEVGAGLGTESAVGAGLGTESAAGAGAGAEAAATTTSIWSTIGSYISDALVTILTW